MALTKEQVGQRAVILLGETPPASFTAGGVAADTLNVLYEPTVTAALASQGWHFAKMLQLLVKDATDPINKKWASSYIVPTVPPPLSIRTVTSGDKVIPYDLYEKYIYCDADDGDQVYMEYIWRVLESNWPNDFVEYVTYRLAAVCAIPITGKPEIFRAFEAEAERLRLKVGYNESAGRTTSRLALGLARRSNYPNYLGG